MWGKNTTRLLIFSSCGFPRVAAGQTRVGNMRGAQQACCKLSVVLLIVISAATVYCSTKNAFEIYSHIVEKKSHTKIFSLLWKPRVMHTLILLV